MPSDLRTSSPALVPPWVRRRALPWMIVATVVLVGGLGALTASTVGPIWPDGFVDRLFYDHRGRFATEGSWMGNLTSPTHFLVMLVIVLAGCAAIRSGRAALTFVVALGLDAVVVEGLKHLVQRRQPTGALTFPSGHIAGAAVLAMVIVLVAWPDGPLGRRLTPVGRRIAVGIAALIVVIVAAGMIMMQDHYFTDCVAAAPLGATITVLVGMGVDAVANWTPLNRRHRPA